MDIDLDKLSLNDLRNLRGKVDRAIATYEERRKREAIAAVENTAREYGFSFSDLASAKTARGKGAPRYANPDNPDMTWTGRGRRPRWVEQALASGRTLADLEI